MYFTDDREGQRSRLLASHSQLVTEHEFETKTGLTSEPRHLTIHILHFDVVHLTYCVYQIQTQDQNI